MGAPVIGLTGYEEHAPAHAVLAGPSAYLHKDLRGEDVVRAVRTVTGPDAGAPSIRLGPGPAAAPPVSAVASTRRREP